jgi:sulfur carrier protein ThiS
VRITFKLFATLGQYLPRELDGQVAVDNQIALEVPAGTTVRQVIDRFPLPPTLVHLVLVNGEYVPPSQRAGRALREGDVLAIWPPIAGG